MKQQQLFAEIEPDMLIVPERVLEKPLDKIANLGTDYCSNLELLESIVGDKRTASNVLTHAEQNLKQLGRISLKALAKVSGMTERKAALLIAALELGRRRQQSDALSRPIAGSSEDAAAFFRSKLGDLSTEHFCVMFLNRANKVIRIVTISQGGMTGTVADPRHILKMALELEAVSMILSHNHPSGSVKPSRADEDLTHKIKEASKYFDIKVLDHIIVSQDEYYSFADEGIL